MFKEIAEMQTFDFSPREWVGRNDLKKMFNAFQ